MNELKIKTTSISHIFGCREFWIENGRMISYWKIKMWQKRCWNPPRSLGSCSNEGNGNGNIRVLTYGMFWQWLAKFSGWHKHLIEQWKRSHNVTKQRPPKIQQKKITTRIRTDPWIARLNNRTEMRIREIERESGESKKLHEKNRKYE